MSIKTFKAAIKELQKREARIAKERDNLRDLECEVGALADDLDEACYDLQRAIDNLSKYV